LTGKSYNAAFVNGEGLNTRRPSPQEKVPPRRETSDKRKSPSELNITPILFPFLYSSIAKGKCMAAV
jgi:hypothetical protein